MQCETISRRATLARLVVRMGGSLVLAAEAAVILVAAALG